MKIRVSDREDTTIFSLDDRYGNLHETALHAIFESFTGKECKIEVDER
jgi:hypothetical protein